MIINFSMMNELDLYIYDLYKKIHIYSRKIYTIRIYITKKNYMHIYDIYFVIYKYYCGIKEFEYIILMKKPIYNETTNK